MQLVGKRPQVVEQGAGVRRPPGVHREHGLQVKQPDATCPVLVRISERPRPPEPFRALLHLAHLVKRVGVDDRCPEGALGRKVREQRCPVGELKRFPQLAHPKAGVSVHDGDRCDCHREPDALGRLYADLIGTGRLDEPFRPLRHVSVGA